MSAIELINIGKSYDNGLHYVIKDMNLTIQEHDFVVILGPSGCGKSTTLRMIAGIEDISSGDLIMDGIRVNDIPSKNRDIAMVFQNYALFPHMKVYDNIAFALKIKKLSKDTIKKRVDKAASILGLEAFLDRKPGELSGGQQQRVALGRAMVNESKFFLMDEPLSNLDANLRTQMREEILSLHKRLETTTVFVTHDQVEAMTMATKIVVLNHGKVMQVGSPSEIYDQPANNFVAKFIGNPKMNMFDVHIQEGKIFLGKNGSTLNVMNHLDNQAIQIGIRPEHLLFDTKEQSHLEGIVYFTEMLGSDINVFVETDLGKIIVRTSRSENVEEGEKVYIRMLTDKLHVFNIDTGEKMEVKVSDENE